MQAALSAAERERLERTVAEDASKALQHDGDRRALVFNNAVRAAVARVQVDSDRERAALSSQVRPANFVWLFLYPMSDHDP